MRLDKKIAGRAKNRTKPRDPRQRATFAFAQCLARIFRLAGRRCAPRCTARFRRLPTMILDPRHASLIAASRILKDLHYAENVSVESQLLIEWLRIERPSSADCSAGPLSSVGDPREPSNGWLEKGQISADSTSGGQGTFLYVT